MIHTAMSTTRAMTPLRMPIEFMGVPLRLLVSAAPRARAAGWESIAATASEPVAVTGRELASGFRGAGGGNRTHTLLPESDFESDASTSSATPALDPAESRE